MFDDRYCITLSFLVLIVAISLVITYSSLVCSESTWARGLGFGFSCVCEIFFQVEACAKVVYVTGYGLCRDTVDGQNPA